MCPSTLETCFKMGKATLTFHGNLLDFIHRNVNNPEVEITFSHKTAVKHTIESLGVPHPEIGRIECRGQTINLSYAIQDGDDIHVYPPSPGNHLFETENPRFVLDNHLGKLTDYLRLLGFDAIYAKDWSDQEIAQYAHDQKRILLTRDRGLLKRKIVTVGHCVRADNPVEQLSEIVSLFDLESFITPFQRCPRCNGALDPVEKDQIIDQLLPLTRKYYDEFTRCLSCGQIYWKGSHFDHMQSLLEPYIGNNKYEP